jgi:hypothetical protein
VFKEDGADQEGMVDHLDLAGNQDSQVAPHQG